MGLYGVNLPKNKRELCSILQKFRNMERIFDLFFSSTFCSFRHTLYSVHKYICSGYHGNQLRHRNYELKMLSGI